MGRFPNIISRNNSRILEGHGLRMQSIRLEAQVVRRYPRGPSAQIVGFQGPKTIQGMDLGPKTLLFGYSDPLINPNRGVTSNTDYEVCIFYKHATA